MMTVCDTYLFGVLLVFWVSYNDRKIHFQMLLFLYKKMVEVPRRVYFPSFNKPNSAFATWEVENSVYLTD